MSEIRPTPVQLGDVIAGKYRLESKLGEGAMGVVFAARHIDLDELRAIKIMKPETSRNSKAIERFNNEARAAAKTRSEHVVTVHDFGKLESGLPYIVMEHLVGDDLQKVLKKEGGQLPIDKAALYVRQACVAISAAHKEGIIHRDLKPANLFVTKREDGTDCVKVLDFGLSKLAPRLRVSGAESTQKYEIMGTPFYMSPEQMNSTKDVTATTDVWALGVILYELITGQRPFLGRTSPEVHASVLLKNPRAPSSLRDMPPELEGLILRCLAKSPLDRVASAQELADELELFTMPPSSKGGRQGRTSDPLLFNARAAEKAQQRSSEKPPAGPSSIPPPRGSAPGYAQESFGPAGQAPTDAQADNRGPLTPGRKDLRGIHLAGRDLRGHDFSDADLSNAKLMGADLSRAKLVNADLRGADLSGAKLLGAEMRGAKLDGAKLVRTKMLGARLSPGALASADTFGAALPDPGPIELMVVMASPCQSLVFHPSRAIVASAHDDGSVRLWDTASGAPIRVLTGEGSAIAVAFRPDGLVLAAACDDSISLWDISTGALLRAFKRFTAPTRCIAWSPDGAWMVCGSWDGSLYVRDASTGAVSRTLRGHADGVRSVAVSSDGATIASGSADRTIRLFDAASGMERLVLKGHTGGIRCVAWSPTANMIASASSDRSIRLWELAKGEAPKARVLEGHTDAVNSVAFSPGGAKLVSGSSDTTVRLWSVGTYSERSAVISGHRAAVSSVAFSPDSNLIASGSVDTSVRIVGALDGALRHTLSSPSVSARSAAFCLDGASIATGGDDKSVRVWSVRLNARVIARTSDSVACVAVSPDGLLLAVGSQDGTVKVVSAADGAERASLTIPGGPIKSVSWSPDGETLALACGHRSVRLWRPRSGDEPARLAGNRSPVEAVAFRPDGGALAGGSDDCAVYLWRGPSFTGIAQLHRVPSPVRALAWDSSGTALALGGRAKRAYLIDAATGKGVVGFGNHKESVRSVAVSPDGSTLATGSDDRAIMLWDMKTGAALKTLRGHMGSVTSVEWSEDGTALASASDDGSVRLWEMATGACLVSLLAFPNGWAAITPDGRLRTGGDTAGAVWHVIGLCRFEPGELDSYLPAPLRMSDAAPLVQIQKKR